MVQAEDEGSKENLGEVQIFLVLLVKVMHEASTTLRVNLTKHQARGYQTKSHALSRLLDTMASD